MGWTFLAASHYKNGKIDRKAECDAYFEEGLNKGYYKIIKSALVGTVYYAAVQALKQYGARCEDGTRQIEDIPAGKRLTWGIVMLTAVDNKGYCNFGYKVMSEDDGPAESKCPESILSLLSPTDCEYANAWRARCGEYNQKKKSPNAIQNLPVGTIIRYIRRDGKEVCLVKHPAAYQFKKPFWYNSEQHTYVAKKYIPENFEIVSKPAE